MEVIIRGIHQNVAEVHSDELLIKDVQSALDLMATIRYEHGCRRIVVHKRNVTEDFFKLSTRLAGDVLQKFVNYQVKLAIVGDYSIYTSRPLQDFIFESNRGNHIFFVPTAIEAIDRLSD